MKKILIVITLILLLTTVATAEGYRHEVTIVLDGEWDLQQRVNTPNSNSSITLVGIGKAEIVSVLTESPTWWDLF